MKKVNEYDIKFTEGEMVVLYEALLYYMEEAEVPKSLYESCYTLESKVFKIRGYL